MSDNSNPPLNLTTNDSAWIFTLVTLVNSVITVTSHHLEEILSLHNLPSGTKIHLPKSNKQSSSKKIQTEIDWLISQKNVFIGNLYDCVHVPQLTEITFLFCCFNDCSLQTSYNLLCWLSIVPVLFTLCNNPD